MALGYTNCFDGYSGQMGEQDLLIVAGEASGDLAGSRLLHELYRMVPQIKPFGLGGDDLVAAGLEPMARSSEISVVGIIEVAKIYARAREIFEQLLDEVDRRGARAALLVDFPDFNLRLAKALKKRGVKVIYYVSPQIWAWRKGRINLMAKYVDSMLVLFPFEVDLYLRRGIDVVHVGHPLVDEVPESPQVWDEAQNQIDPLDSGQPVQVSLLPGSRLNEVERLLPTMLEAVALLAERTPLRTSIIRAETVDLQVFETIVTGSGVDVEMESRSDRFRVLANSHLALCASGTATLEVGLTRTPLIMLYKTGFWSYWLARALVKLPYYSLVNLVLGRQAVPELVQYAATPEKICEASWSLLSDQIRLSSMRSALAEIRGKLGEGGASRRAAGEVARRLGKWGYTLKDAEQGRN
jgi:lipid-A-disaccharide synthase